MSVIPQLGVSSDARSALRFQNGTLKCYSSAAIVHGIMEAF